MHERKRNEIIFNIFFFCSYETDRYNNNNTGNGRNYRDTDYQQGQRHENSQSRRPNNNPTGNTNRGRRTNAGKLSSLFVSDTIVFGRT